MSNSMFFRFLRLAVATLILTLGAPTFGQTGDTGQLQQLVNDFGFQLNMLRDFDGRAAEERTRALAVALDRWNSSTRTDADYQKMKQWLDAAIDATMPGSKDPLPALPWFEKRLAEAPQLPLPNEPQVAEAPAEEAPEPAATAGHRIANNPQAKGEPERQPTPERPAPAPAAAAAAAESPQVASFWQRHPGARPLKLENPFEDDEPLATTSLTKRVAMRPTAFSSTSDAPSTVGVNTAELSARVRGYTHGLKGVEARLVASPTMSMEELLSVVRELRQLASQRDFVSMYLDVVALDHPDQVPQLPTLDDAKSMAQQRIEQLRKRDTGHTAAMESLQQMLSDL